MISPTRFVLASLVLATAALAQPVPVPLGGTIGPVTNNTQNTWTWTLDPIDSGIILPGQTAGATIPNEPALCGQVLKLTCDFPPLAPFTVEILIVCP
jgi:hypothetical protein